MYISVEALTQSFSQAILVQLSNDVHSATEINQTVVSQAIRFACERIDAALRGRYRLPLIEVPSCLPLYALFIARYWLYARRPESHLPETVEKTYQQAIRELDQIALGKLHLGIAKVEAGVSDDTLAGVGEYKVIANEKLNLEGY